MATNDLRTPVRSLAVGLYLHDGRRVAARLFLGEGDWVDQLLAEHAPFVPADLGERVRLIARAAIAAIAIPTAREEDRPEWGLPLSRRAVVVELRSGVVLEGEVRFVAPPGRGRTTDFLNEAGASFALWCGSEVVHVAKAHVLGVEEAA